LPAFVSINAKTSNMCQTLAQTTTDLNGWAQTISNHIHLNDEAGGRIYVGASWGGRPS
jgi:hypothetical protein